MSKIQTVRVDEELKKKLDEKFKGQRGELSKQIREFLIQLVKE
jgi:predicted transcriptional regulator